ncbi:uncharacterized protein TrAtP1_006725 [Trichoderma atroviride]|uniref:uncharacterized protein n=1 Tax=Hypocrea atroviridis TaxID=63577 RepID=UPI003323CCC2|nr:hypothetical protein TrAtP1_006725 [Trichoderma atroviride]
MALHNGILEALNQNTHQHDNFGKEANASPLLDFKSWEGDRDGEVKATQSESTAIEPDANTIAAGGHIEKITIPVSSTTIANAHTKAKTTIANTRARAEAKTTIANARADAKAGTDARETTTESTAIEPDSNTVASSGQVEKVAIPVRSETTIDTKTTIATEIATDVYTDIASVSNIDAASVDAEASKVRTDADVEIIIAQA